MTESTDARQLTRIVAKIRSLPGFQNLQFTCPNTGVPLRPQTLRASIVVPDETDLVIELLDGRFNTIDCVCGSKHVLAAPVMAIHSATGEIICVGGGASVTPLRNVMTRLGPPFNRAAFCDDYDGLLRHVLGWLDAMLLDFVNDVHRGKFDKFTPAERIVRRHKTLLVYLHDLADGLLPATVALSDGTRASPDVARKFHHTVYVGVMKGQLDDLMTEFGPSRLIVEASARIPARAISEGLLVELAQRAAEELRPLLDDAPAANASAAPTDSKDAFTREYAAGIKNAVVHAIAGQTNPQARRWAALVRQAWQIWSDSDENPVLPPSDQAARVVAFEPLWDHVRDELKDANGAKAEQVLEDLRRMFTRLGHAERFKSLMQAGVLRFETDDEADLIEFVLEAVMEKAKLLVSPATSYMNGGMAGASVQTFLSSGSLKSARAFASRYLETVLAVEDYIAAFAFGKEAIPALCHAERPGEAASIALQLCPLFREPRVTAQLQRAEVGLTVSFWNECGSLFRYLGRPKEALDAYHISRGFLPLLNDSTDRAGREKVLDLNEGLAMRDQGHFVDAWPRISRAAEASPANPAVQINLAMLLLSTGHFTQAEAIADRAVACSDPVMGSGQYARALIMRAEARRMLLRPEAAISDLSEAMGAAPVSAHDMRVRIAFAATQITGARALAPDLIAEAERVLRDEVASGEAAHLTEYHLTKVIPIGLTGLGQLLLDEQRYSELETFDRDSLDPFLAGTGAESSVDWRLLRLKGLIEKHRGGGWNELAWNFFEAAAAEIDTDAPNGPDARFAGGWLANKEAFQLEFMEATITMVAQGAVPTSALLRAYELANGRELAASLNTDRPGPKIADLLQALTTAKEDLGRSVLVVAFLDTPVLVRVLVLNANDGACMLLPAPCWAAAHVEQTSSRFIRTMDTTNPAAPETIERQLVMWRAMMEELGAAVAPYLTAGALVAMLPGRRMSSLPLHLMMLPEQRGELLLSHSVVFSANLALLLDVPQPAPICADCLSPIYSRMVVACAKERDSRNFRRRLARVTRRITQGGTSHRILRLSGRRATPERVLASVASADTLFLLCHGANIGRRKGFGIYLSDGRDLPPAMAIDIDVAPDVGRFALAWDDFSTVERTPRLIVSLACSSARTVLASGGVRIGPEAAAFSKGTEAIIAPLWNVEQEAALSWVERFEIARGADGTLPVWDAYRQACLDLRADYKQAFFWGAFLLNGRLRGLARHLTGDYRETKDVARNRTS